MLLPTGALSPLPPPAPCLSGTPRTVDVGELSGLVRTVLDIHRLKTGYPVVLCAQLGALTADASPQSRRAMSLYAMAL